MKNTWASIVKKPASVANNEISPMQVVVPEPPMRGSLMGGNEPPMRGRLMSGNEYPIVNTDSESAQQSNVTFKFQSILTSLDSQKSNIEAEIKQKKDKFHASYVYTKYINEIANLNSEKSLIEKKLHFDDRDIEEYAKLVEC
jgi:hypothetical protein